MTHFDENSPWGGTYLRPREILQRYGDAVAYVVVTTKDGDERIGTAFHIGDGVLITARHVVDGNEIKSIGHSYSCVSPKDVWYKRGSVENVRGSVVPDSSMTGPFYHPNEKVDVAVIVLEGLDRPVIPLGFHLDDWLDSSLTLTEAIVMGYPPIPFAREPMLVAARAEVNAIVDLHGFPHPRFVLSTMARGGFSGGPAISCYDFSLGVITDSLCHNEGATELGYLTVLSVEPILDTLGFHEVLPRGIEASWSLYGGDSPWKDRSGKDSIENPLNGNP